MKPTVGIYYRVSTVSQDLDVQKQMLPQFARQRKWRIYDTYEDDGISGSTIEARPGFKKLLDDLQNECFRFLLVKECSRVTRAESAQERGLIIDLLLKHRVVLVDALGIEIDANTPMGERYLLDVFWMAKQERANIAHRMFDGREQKMLKGFPMYRGKLWGRSFQVIKKSKSVSDWTVKWVITDQTKIDKVRQGGMLILEKRFGWRRAAQEAGMSFQTLRRIIVNQGGSTFCQKNVCKSYGLEQTHTFIIPEHCRIFDDATVKRILKVVKDNTLASGGPRTKKWLLSSMVRDVHGFSLWPKPKHVAGSRIRKRYYCARGDQRKVKQPNFYVQAGQLEDAVMNCVADLLTSSDLFEDAVFGGKKKSEHRAQLQKDIANFSIELDRAKHKKNTIIDKIADRLISDKEAAEKLTIIRADEKRCSKLIKQKTSEIVLIPSKEQIDQGRKEIIRKYTPKGKKVPVPGGSWEKHEYEKHQILNDDFDGKRTLLMKLFSGKDADGRKFGIFVERKGAEVHFELYGNLGINMHGAIDAQKQLSTLNVSKKTKSNTKEYRHAQTDQARSQTR